MTPVIRKKSSKGASEEGAPKRSLGRLRNITSNGFDPGDDDIKGMLPSGLARTFVQSQLKSAESQLKSHGLVAPDDYDGEFPELPDDIDGIDYSELSNIMLAFQNALATATWQQSYHYIWSGTFEEISDYMEAIALQHAEGSNEPQRKANARTDERVVFFRARYKEHYNSYVRFRDLARTIDGKIKAVSRVLGFKDEEETATKLSAIKRRGSSKRPRSK